MTQTTPRFDKSERDRLLHAMETAHRTQFPDAFQHWVRGAFHALLPYEYVVFVGDSKRDESLPPFFLIFEQISGFPRPPADLDHISRLARSLIASTPHDVATHVPTIPIPPPPIAPSVASGPIAHDAALVANVDNAVVHRLDFLNGARCHLVLVNLPATGIDRAASLLQLLEPQLKKALAPSLGLLADVDDRPPLTPRQQAVLAAIQQGHSNRQISQALGINPKTLRDHITKLYRKLDVRSRHDAVAIDRQD